MIGPAATDDHLVVNQLVRAWALHRLRQAQQIGFLPSNLNVQSLADPAAAWRNVSAQIFQGGTVGTGMPVIQHPQLLDTPAQLFNPPKQTAATGGRAALAAALRSAASSPLAFSHSRSE